MATLRYTHAIVCRLPQSLKSCKEINLDEAKKQHECYVRLLRELGLDVIELPPDEALPECVFVEDTAVVCNGTALITRPGNPQRAKEIDTIRVVLKKELDLPIIEMSDTSAKLDGGDVLFTGKEFFVGLSDWTNEAGARAVAVSFPEYPCTPIKVSGQKHLKSLVTVGGPDLLCIGKSQEAQEVLKRMEREATFSYQTITLPEDEAANVLYLNGTLVHRSTEEIPESFKYRNRTIRLQTTTHGGLSEPTDNIVLQQTDQFVCEPIRPTWSELLHTFEFRPISSVATKSDANNCGVVSFLPTKSIIHEDRSVIPSCVKEPAGCLRVVY